MGLRYVELDQLSESDFIGLVKDNKLTIHLKPKPVEVNSWVTNTPANNIATFVDTQDGRKRLQVKDGFGLLHLDFFARTANLGVNGTWRLPENSPTPKSLIEIQTYDRGTIWIAANSRVIRWSGLTSGNRYIVDLVGFWE